MGILIWIVLGLVAGFLAKLIMGSGKGGLIATTLLGVVGAFVGGFIGTRLGWGDINGFNIRSVGLAVAGAVLVLGIYRMVAK